MAFDFNNFGSPVQQSKPSGGSGGFLGGLVKSIASPIVKIGVSGYNAVTNSPQDTQRNVPFFGQTKGIQSPIKEGGFISPEGKLQNPINFTGLRQAAGIGAELGSYLGGGGEAAGGVKSLAKTSLKSLIKSGAKVGAIAGGVTGLGTELQKDKTTVTGVAKSTALGALTGAAIGGITAAAGKGIQSLSKESRTARFTQKADERALNSIVPTPKELTPTEYADMLRSGRVTPKTTLGTAQIVPTKQETTLAGKFKDLLQSKDPVSNTNSVLGKISEIDKSVGDYLQSKKIIYNTGELKNALSKSIENITDITVPNEKGLERVKQDVVDTLVNDLKSNDLRSLWQARKSFDQLIKNRLNAYGGTPTLKKEVARGVRNAAQEFITNKLGNDTYKVAMKDMSQLFDLADLVDNKAVRERSQSAIKAWIARNPAKYNLVKWALGGTVAYEGAKRFGIVP